MISLKDICNKLDINCQKDINITGLNTLKDAKDGEISFLENKKYVTTLTQTKATAVFVTDDMRICTIKCNCTYL